MTVPSQYKQYGQSIIVGVLTGLILALIFSTGFFLRDIIDPQPNAEQILSQAGYPLLDEVQTLIDKNYLKEQPSYIDRQYAAIRGVLNELGDRNTFFIEPPVAQSETDVLAGTYGGIGASVHRNAAGDFALYPFPDGPAAKAGLKDGDILQSINGDPVDITTKQDVVDQMLRGEVKDGNGVAMTILRDENTIEYFILFDVINVPSVIWRVMPENKDVGYVQIVRFTNRTPSELTTAIEELRQQGISSLILDLRSNSGGLLKESIDVASVFLDGVVVAYEETVQDEHIFMADEGGIATDIPLVTLVNVGTASAAELVSGALQDHQRSILIGQTTYGKGTVQQIFRLSDSSSIHITWAEWFTPNRRAIDGTGLEPDIYMIPDENGRDIEIAEAVLYLNQLKSN